MTDKQSSSLKPGDFLRPKTYTARYEVIARDGNTISLRRVDVEPAGGVNDWTRPAVKNAFVLDVLDVQEV